MKIKQRIRPKETLYTCAICPAANGIEYYGREFIAHMQTVHYHLFEHILMQFAQRVYFNELVYEKTVLEGKESEWCDKCQGQGLIFREGKATQKRLS